MRQRALERVENEFGSDLVCAIEIEGMSFDCDVADFNALGFRLTCRDKRQFALLAHGNITRAKVMYGDYVLGVLTLPKVVRASLETKKVVLVPSPRSTVQIVERPRRANVPYLLEPMIVGPDPMRLREKMIFRVDNISETGFRAKCSLSNRHLFQGQIMNGFTIALPTMGTHTCSFTIMNVRADHQHLIVHCAFNDLRRPFTKVLRNFMLLSLFTKNEEGVKMGEERMPKKLSSLLRVRRVNQSLEMDKVLQLRLSAYKAANKVSDGATTDVMSDEFDKNSIVLGAYIGSQIAGTVRVVFSRDGSSFPFEKTFPFPEGKRYRRGACVELSRMAVDPALQGSDMVFRLMQAAALEFVPKTDFAFLMSTDDLANNYLMIGAERLAGPVPHPVSATEHLSLFVFTVGKLKSGRMSALAWIFFAREIIEFMSRFGFTGRTATPIFKYLLVPLELSLKKSKKFFRQLRRRRSR